MKTKSPPRLALRSVSPAAAILGAAFLASLASAQLAPALPPASNAIASAAADVAVELSPFTIVAEREIGWVATQTLAGSRMKTDFKDIAQPIEVMTKDFLEDLALNNFEQALNYSTNVAGPLDYADNSNNNGIGFGNQQPKNNTIGRGLGNLTNSVDFFESSMPSDSYNIERITVARGPNAILFGLGSPSGIVDSTLKRGLLGRNLAQVQFRVTSDASKRASFDLNRVLVKDRLALRFDGMTDDGLTHIKPNLDRQTRRYGALTAKPFQTTTVTVAYENVFWNSNRAKTVLPVDAFSPWLNAAAVPGSPYTANQPIFDNRTTLAGSNPIFGRSNNSNLLMSFGGFGAVGNGDIRNWTNAVITKEPQTAYASSLNSFDRFSFSAKKSPVPYDTNLFGDQQFVQMKSSSWNVFLEQQLARNLFLEAAWFHQGYFEQIAGAGFSGIIYIDANQFLPDGVTPNPNVGRYFSQRAGSANGNQDGEEKRDDYRATLSYELDLSRKAGRLGKWLLGRMRFAGMVSQDNFRARNQQYLRGILENPTLPGAPILPSGSVGTGSTGTGTRNWATNLQRDLITRFYLGGSAGNAPGNPFGDLFGTWNFTDAAGKPYAAYTSTTPYKSVEGWPLARSSAGVGGSKQRTDTQMFAFQDFLLDERLVLLYGYRKDTAKSASIDPKYLNQDWSGMFPSWHVADFGAWGRSQSGATTTYGIVAHLTPWLSGIYNRSDTFQPNIGKFDPFGNEYPGAVGKATDYGVSLNLLHDTLRLRVSRFDNSAGPSRAGNSPFQDPFRDNLFNIDDEMLQLDPSLPRLNAGKGGYRELGRANYWVMYNSQSTGYELDLSWQPTNNWSFVVNGAKTSAVQNDMGAAWIPWINARLPVWQSLNVPEGGKTTPRDVDGDGKIGTWTWDTAPFNGQNGAKTFAQQYNDAIVAQGLGLFNAVNGTSTDQGRGYRGNFIAQYRITEGRLKGVSTNLAFRYRGAPSLGYGVVTKNGVLVLDPTNPIYGPATVNTDAGLIYSGRLEAFRGLKYRVQLNVRNLLNEWTLVPVKAISTGQYVRYNRLPPRTYVMSTTFDF